MEENTMNSNNSNFDLPNQPEYFKNFWDYARGREDSDAFLEAGKKPSGSYVLPTSSATKYDEALKRESLFRTIGTYVYSHSGPSKLLGKHTTDDAAWVPDGEAIPIYDGINDFTEFAMEDHKLAAIMRMDASFLQDNPHVFGDYFIKRMARCFGSAESDGFINGTGVDMPTGILSENGAAVGVTASAITFDDVIRLYFSVDKQFRQRGAWLMNDEHRCGTPHLYEEDIKRLFLQAVANLTEAREVLMETCQMLLDEYLNTEKIDAECAALETELEIVSELTRKLIAENATTVIQQEEYNRRYDELVQRYRDAEDRAQQLQNQKVTRRFQADVIESFMNEIRAFDNSLPVQYSDRLWLNLIDRVAVYEDGRLVFRFKNGTEITETL